MERPMAYVEAELLLARAEGVLSIAGGLLAGQLTPKNKAIIARQLAGVVADVETVKAWLTRPALKHCPVHEDYQDSCHECYLRQYGRQKGA